MKKERIKFEVTVLIWHETKTARRDAIKTAREDLLATATGSCFGGSRPIRAKLIKP